jgi:hypothetical protein
MMLPYHQCPSHLALQLHCSLLMVRVFYLFSIFFVFLPISSVVVGVYLCVVAGGGALSSPVAGGSRRKDSDGDASIPMSMDDRQVDQKKYFWCRQPKFQLHFIQVRITLVTLYYCYSN